MGADPERVHIVSHTHYDGRRREFDPASDMPLLVEAARKLGDVRLLIVDPVVTAISGDGHKNAEVRRGLAPLVDFAQKLGAAVIGVTHFTKGTEGRAPLDRLTGSLAFGAAPRLVFAVMKAQTGALAAAEESVFVRIKSNIGPDVGGSRNWILLGILRQPDASRKRRTVFQRYQGMLDDAHSSGKGRDNHRHTPIGGGTFALENLRATFVARDRSTAE